MIFDMRVRPPELLGELPKDLQGFGIYRLEERGRPYQDEGRGKWLEAMDEVGITHAMLIAPPWYDHRKANEIISSITEEHEGRFIGSISLNINDGKEALQELERCVRELGLRCLLLRPFKDRVYANDRRYYPFYAKCVELEIPVSIVIGLSFSAEPVLDFGRPLYLDHVACDFPELRIIATHGGWPWVTETVAVSWKNDNVFIDISGIAPRYIGMSGTGWDPLIRYGDTLLQDKILWGTDWPLLDWKDSLSQCRELPLKEESKEKWLFKNAEALFQV
jgi:predicted TIM-barrel fold metal-dependent hydrolase